MEIEDEYCSAAEIDRAYRRFALKELGWRVVDHRNRVVDLELQKGTSRTETLKELEFHTGTGEVRTAHRLARRAVLLLLTLLCDCCPGADGARAASSAKEHDKNQ